MMILVDTDIIVDYLRGYEKSKNFFEKYNSMISISSLTQMELIIGCKTKNDIHILNDFLSTIFILEANKEIVQNAIHLLQNFHLTCGLGIVDSIIAATSFYYEINLYTRNQKHYQNIKNLNIYKPY
jgi:predicted nucleic acid-binding protein